MWRIALDLNKDEDKAKVNGVWRYALGYIPGEPNQGLTAETEGSPARLADYDDSGWEICGDLRLRVSKGFTFAWWRITVEVPETLNGLSIAGSRLLFETNIDDYGEIWVDGEIDPREGAVTGYNRQQRVVVSPNAEPGTKHVIACMAANGPLGKPNGAIFVRYATLAFERSP
jgi:gluconolactonase